MSLASHWPVVRCLIKTNSPAKTLHPLPSNLYFGLKCSNVQRVFEFKSHVTETSWNLLNLELLIGDVGKLCK